MAEELGKRLLAEVQADKVGLDEILHLLRTGQVTSAQVTSAEYFNFQPLDRLLSIAANTALPTNAAQQYRFPVVEISSLVSGGGKTHLVYFLCALAILPRELGGRQACTVIVDTDATFSVPRLATHMRNIVQKQDTSLSETAQDDSISTALRHVHILRPQTLGSTIATIDELPAYLFDKTRHNSFDRAVGFLAIDSAPAFYWQDRAETEDAAFIASTSPAANPGLSPSAYGRLASAIKVACRALNCPAIVTTWHLGPTPTLEVQGRLPRSVRPALPPAWQSLPTLRLLVQRLPIRKFPPGISVEEALQEAEDRRKAVEAGRFECVVNEWGVNDGMVRSLRQAGGGFEFTILDEGVVASGASWGPE